jgi:hypothetical protein
VEKYSRARHATDDNIIQCTCFACWITKATDIHAEYVILIAFLRKKWLCKLASLLHHIYNVCLVSAAVSDMSVSGLYSITNKQMSMNSQQS